MNSVLSKMSRIVSASSTGVGFFSAIGEVRNRGVDLVVETAQAFLLIRAAEALVLLKQFGNAADLAFHGLTTGLSGVRREDGVEFELVEQFLGLGRASLIDELVVGDGELVDRVDRLVKRTRWFSRSWSTETR